MRYENEILIRDTIKSVFKNENERVLKEKDAFLLENRELKEKLKDFEKNKYKLENLEIKNKFLEKDIDGFMEFLSKYNLIEIKQEEHIQDTPDGPQGCVEFYCEHKGEKFVIRQIDIG